MTKTHYLYLITRDDGEKYVGVTIDPSRRKLDHSKGRGSKHLVGREFSFEILDMGNKEYIYGLEAKAIQDNGCTLNIAPGGIYSFNPVYGEKHPLSILSEDAVIEIKNELTKNRSINITNLANKYGVSRNCISAVANNHNWKDVGLAVPKRVHVLNDTNFIDQVKSMWLKERLTIAQISAKTNRSYGTIQQITSKFSKRNMGVLGGLQI